MTLVWALSEGVILPAFRLAPDPRKVPRALPTVALLAAPFKHKSISKRAVALLEKGLGQWKHVSLPAVKNQTWSWAKPIVAAGKTLVSSI